MHHTRKLTDAQEAVVAEAYRKGELTSEIAHRFGVGRKTINNALRRQECPTRDKVESQRVVIERRRKRQEKHPNFRDGRSLTRDGYVVVAVDEDDPMGSMVKERRSRLAQSGYGYVLEHRLVMARSLGRPLTSTETVHHRNGDRADNRIENLQLRQGRHGKGVAYRCCDCGSTNVEVMPLA